MALCLILQNLTLHCNSNVIRVTFNPFPSNMAAIKFRTNPFSDLYLGVDQTPSERSSVSPQLRSVSCSELQANGVSYGAPEVHDLHRRVIHSYTSRLPPSGHNCQSQQNGKPKRQNSSPLKTGSSGKLNNLVLFLKSPKVCCILQDWLNCLSI